MEGQSLQCKVISSIDSSFSLLLKSLIEDKSSSSSISVNIRVSFIEKSSSSYTSLNTKYARQVQQSIYFDESEEDFDGIEGDVWLGGDD